MTLTIHDDVPQRSDEWHALRRGIVTASSVGQLLTPTVRVADNDKSRRLTASLVAERITGTSEPTYVNDDMFRGIEHEPYARDIYSGHYQQAVECGFMRRDEDDWSLGFSPDGLVADDGLVEIKCPRAKSHIETVVTGEAPYHYMPQLQAGLLVSGRKWIDYVSFCAGLPLFVKRVEPDEKWHAVITEAVKRFEAEAAAMTADYEAKSKGLPPTKHIDRLSDIQVA